MMVQQTNIQTRTIVTKRRKTVEPTSTYHETHGEATPTTIPTQYTQRTTARSTNYTNTSVGYDEQQEPVARFMDLAMLMKRCARESERFYRGQQHDTSFSYELFRRALVERSEAAWEQLYHHYHGLVEGWVRRSGAFNSSGESSEFFVVGAFTKFWRAITPERFDSFPTLASLLHYLQLCATSVVIDSVRTQSWSEMLPEETITPSAMPQYSPDEEAINRVQREEFWQLIDTQLNDEVERVVVYCSFILGLTPRAIFARRNDLFRSVNDVYNVKRNVLGRLGRNNQLRQLYTT
jgi:DNA-directed RNA polymerase specialized sigma24 family protein